MLEELKKPLLLITGGLFIFFIFSKVFGPIPFTVTTTNRNEYLSADGMGEAQAIPEEARISIGVNKRGKTVEEVKNAANQVINDVTKELRSLGIEEKQIKTTSYSLYPEYSIQPVPLSTRSATQPAVDMANQGITGYTANINMEITTDSTDRANKALDAATKLGANQVGGISFVLSDETRERLTNEARKQAIEKAREKARTITKETGIRLGRIVNIYESVPGDMYSYEQKSAVSPQAVDMATDLNPGESTIKVSVTLSYETL